MRTTIIWTPRVSVLAREEPVLIGNWVKLRTSSSSQSSSLSAGSSPGRTTWSCWTLPWSTSSPCWPTDSRSEGKTGWFVYFLSLLPTNSADYPRYDQTIFTNGSQPVIWAVGPVNSKVGQSQAQQTGAHVAAPALFCLKDTAQAPKGLCLYLWHEGRFHAREDSAKGKKGDLGCLNCFLALESWRERHILEWTSLRPGHNNKGIQRT